MVLDFSNFEIIDGDVHYRKEPLFLCYEPVPHITSISETRANRPEEIGKPEYKVSDPTKCIFCEPKIYEVTPEPKITHKEYDIYTGRSLNKIISFPNKYPFARVHYVTVFSEHKEDLNDLTLEDMDNYFNSVYELAKEIKKDKKVKAMCNFVNWGLAAGASQNHPHTQTLGLPTSLGLLEDHESRAVNFASAITKRDPFEIYIETMRDSPYFIFENDKIFITAPFAPRLPDQVDVISKDPIQNVLETLDDRAIMAESMLGIFHALRKKREVLDLNVTLHQESFDRCSSFYRLHWHICPRNKNKIGSMELDRFYVVPVFPEKTAKELREWYS